MVVKLIFLKMKMFSLKNKIVVITGASGLLGFEHSKAVAKAEGIPILLDINLNKIKSKIKILKNDFDVDCSGYCVDITNEKSVIENCKKIVKKYGRIDCLINNAANNPKIII